MNCPNCGQRTLASLSNCPHCDAYLGEANNRQGGNSSGFGGGNSSGFSPDGSNPWADQAVRQGGQVVSGKTMMAVLAGFGLLAAIVFIAVPMYHEAMGNEAHYRVLWCTSTAPGSIATAPGEIRAEGFVAESRMAPGYSRLGEEERMSRVECFSRDYGKERPSYRSINNSREYRVVSTYYVAPEESSQPTPTGDNDL